MSETAVLLDAFTRVNESLHRMLSDLNEDELHKEPHPSIGWLAWRLSRVIDNNASRLAGLDQLWVAGGWGERFGMKPALYDFGRSKAHTREQVRAFRASVELLLGYHDAVHARIITYLKSLTAEDLARELNEPQYQPLPTIGVRLVSVLENAMNNQGQIGFLKAYHRLGGWFPSEAKDPSSYL
jgi:hypothetical protein